MMETPAAERDQQPLSTLPSARNNVAAALRALTALVVGRSIDDEALNAVSTTLNEVVEDLTKAAAPGRRPRGHPIASGHPQDYFWTSPLAGHANPLAVPVSYWAATDESGVDYIVGEANFPLQYEGPPTCVHGGVIAELFDELLGNANIISGHAGMTGTLTVRYNRPTPLLTDLALEARFIEQVGRKITTRATITVDGVVTAEATGLFIEVAPTQMLGIITANADRAGDGVVDAELTAAIEAETARRESSGH